MKLAIALNSSHKQWKKDNPNGKEVVRKRMKPPTAKNIFDTDNCVEDVEKRKDEKYIMKENQLKRIANFQRDKTKVEEEKAGKENGGLDEEKRKLIASFK